MAFTSNIFVAPDVEADRFFPVFAKHHPHARCKSIHLPQEAFRLAEQSGGSENKVAILVTGSLHLVGEALQYVKEC